MIQNTDDISITFEKSQSITDDKIKMFIGSWNVGNEMPPKSSAVLGSWIPFHGGDYDVIVVGLQESTYKEKKASETSINTEIHDEKHEDSNEGNHTSISKSGELLLTSLNDTFDYPFFKKIEAHLGQSFVVAGKVELLEMRLIVFVHKTRKFDQVEKTTEATGIGNVIGNKGGLIFKLRIKNTSFCFISCHLAAHEGQKFLDKRNLDCCQILKASRIGHKNLDIDSQFHHCFIFGDLNYRIDLLDKFNEKKDNFEQIIKMIHEKNWNYLNINDQLYNQIKNKIILNDWELPNAIFPPTFKYIKTKNEYHQKRIPSYCDRILFKSLPGFKDNLHLNGFHSSQDICTSDHKPVWSSFDIKLIEPIKKESLVHSIDEMTEIEITKIEALNILAMDLDGSSDPYMRFHTEPSEVLYCPGSETINIPMTSIKKNTLNPIWEKKDIPDLYLRINDEMDLRKIHLIFELMDYDATSEDDSLGQTVVSIKDILKFQKEKQPTDINERNNSTSIDETFKISQNILLHGKKVGTLIAHISIIPNTRPHQLKNSKKSKKDNSIIGCQCLLS